MTTVLDSASRSSPRGSALTAASEYPALAHDLDVEVCVIGGGLAGITVAREVARRGWSVAVLEARRIAWNASGRNGGFVLPGFSADIDAIIDRVGLAHAKQLWALSAAGVEYVRAAIREIGMPGIDPGDGFLEVSLADRAESLRRRAARMQVDFDAAVENWPTEQVRDLLRTDRYFQALRWPRAFHLHPLTYALGLASAARQAGARIFEGTPALALDVSGVRKRVDTPKGRVRAQHIVLAGGAHLGGLFAANSGTVMPIVSYLGATAPVGDRLRQAIGYAGGVGEMRLGGDHYRVVHGDRLLWGGGIDARTSMPRALAPRIAGRIRETYPQLGKVDVTYAVSGVMAYAVHQMPQIGEIAPRVWLASAFGAQGLNTTAMAGELIARAVIDGDDQWRLFAPYELVWAGGALGRVAAQCLFWAEEVRHRAVAAVVRSPAPRRRGVAAPNRLLQDLREEMPMRAATATDRSVMRRAPQEPDEILPEAPAPPTHLTASAPTTIGGSASDVGDVVASIAAPLRRASRRAE
jgi:gamma-glutamylputrescine oxidase